MTIDYQFSTKTEQFGRFALQLKTLVNFEATVDQIFEHLQRQNQPELLEDLCPYFAHLWVAARGLAQHIALIDDSALKGKNILELGCGLGAPSMIAAMRGAHVVATDFHPDVAQLLRDNCRLNQISPISYEHLDWRSPEGLAQTRWDMIMASDVLYDRSQPEMLAHVLDQLSKVGSPRIIIADPGRGYLQRFMDIMTGHGFSQHSMSQSGEYRNGAEEVYVLEFIRQGPPR